jgi:hypothetical protein
MIAIEGVLSAEDDLKRSAPTKLARLLYDGIRSQFRTVGLSRCSDIEVVRWWLRREQLSHWSSVLGWNSPVSYGEWKVDQVRDFLANGWEIGFYLDSDAETVHAVQGLGVLTLRVGAPVHPPGWRADDTQFRPWSAVADTLDPRP